MTAPDVPWLAVALLACSIRLCSPSPWPSSPSGCRSAVGLAVLALFSQVGQS